MAAKTDFDRKDLKAPDAFFENFGRANRYLQENRRAVLAAAGAVLALFTGGLALHNANKRHADNVAATFLRGTEALRENNTATAKSTLDTVAAKAGIYGELAKLYRAEMAAKAGRWDEALPDYEELTRDGSTAYLRQMASLGKGFVLESTSKPAEAAAAYAAAAEISGPYREQAFRGQLRTARAAGNDELTKAAISKILELYPETADADDLSRQLAAIAPAN